MRKILPLIVILICGLYMNDAKAETIYPCPAGCFCLNGGEYTVVSGNEMSYCTGNGYGYTARTLGSNEGNFFACNTEILNDINFPKQGPQHPNERYYKLSEFSEVYVSWGGAYGFLKNGEFLSLSNCSDGKMIDKVFRCPHTYPYSDEGAISLSECYKYTYTNGGSTTLKEYYKPNSTSTSSGNGNADVNYDIESMKTLVTNLQSLLSQATKAAQDLETALNKAKQSTTTTTSTNSGSSSSTNTNSNSSNNSNSTSSSSTTTTSTNSSSSTTTNKNDTGTKKSLTDILNKLTLNKSATVPVGRAAVYDDGRNRGLTPLTGTAHDTINNRQINSRAATVVSESVAGRNGRDASRNDTRTESRQIDSGRLAR